MANKNGRSYLRITLTVCLLGVLSIYVYMQARVFMKGPILTIESPRNGSSIVSLTDEVVVTGTASHISFLTLNGAQIYVDNEGRFARPISLLPGHNIVTLEGTDKFNRVRRVSVQLTYDPDAIRFQ